MTTDNYTEQYVILDWILDALPPPKEIVQLGKFEYGLDINDSMSTLSFLDVIMAL